MRGRIIFRDYYIGNCDECFEEQQHKCKWYDGSTTSLPEKCPIKKEAVTTETITEDGDRCKYIAKVKK
jgi:hypothetical protein